MSAILEVKDVNELGLSYSPLHPTIGAEVEGVDLSQPISDEVRDDIKTALLKYKVLFFRNQSVNRRQHLDFAKRFGKIYTPPYPADRLVDVDGEPGLHLIGSDPNQKAFYESQRRPGIPYDGYHSDTNWRIVPSWGAILRAVNVPPVGGGLLHDLGKLLLLQVSGIDYQKLAPEVLTQPDRAFVHEREVLGFDHAVLAGHVLDSWKIPGGVAEVVAWHHQPGRAFEHGAELGLGVALVRIANRLDCRMQAHPELDEAFIAELMQDGSVSYTGYQETVLRAMWPKLREAAQQMTGELVQ